MPLARILTLCLILVLLLANAAAGGPFRDLVVFGDSFSDTGNAASTSFGLLPGSAYYEGRFTNGPVYAELLATSLGLRPLEPSGAGGNNFAYAAARTSGTGGLLGFFVEDLDEQVDDFLSRAAGFELDRHTLFVVFAGAGDLLNGQTDPRVPAANIAESVNRLIDGGARQFLVPNVPLLGQVPRYNGDAATSARMNDLSSAVNRELANALDGLSAAHPEVDLFRFDVAGLLTEAFAMPEAFGFTNVSDPVAPGLEPGTLDYDLDRLAGDPETYLFWDDLHPTAAAHSIFAEHALAALQVPEPSGLLLGLCGLLTLMSLRTLTSAGHSG